MTEKIYENSVPYITLREIKMNTSTNLLWGAAVLFYTLQTALLLVLVKVASKEATSIDGKMSSASVIVFQMFLGPLKSLSTIIWDRLFGGKRYGRGLAFVLPPYMLLLWWIFLSEYGQGSLEENMAKAISALAFLPLAVADNLFDEIIDKYINVSPIENLGVQVGKVGMSVLMAGNAHLGDTTTMWYVLTTMIPLSFLIFVVFEHYFERQTVVANKTSNEKKSKVSMTPFYVMIIILLLGESWVDSFFGSIAATMSVAHPVDSAFVQTYCEQTKKINPKYFQSINVIDPLKILGIDIKTVVTILSLIVSASPIYKWMWGDEKVKSKSLRKWHAISVTFKVALLVFVWAVFDLKNASNDKCPSSGTVIAWWSSRRGVVAKMLAPSSEVVQLIVALLQITNAVFDAVISTAAVSWVRTWSKENGLKCSTTNGLVRTALLAVPSVKAFAPKVFQFSEITPYWCGLIIVLYFSAEHIVNGLERLIKKCAHTGTKTD